MSTPSCEWKRHPHRDWGIICGADHAQEWLLPWWWSRYSSLHDLPVTFCDFGMGQEMRNWCAERGEVISIALGPECVIQKRDLHPELIEHGESIYGERVWAARQQWFKKPFALLESPYKTALWIDLDCEILKPLTPLFSAFDPVAEMALVRESSCSHLPKGDPELRYNGGIVLFRQGSSLIEKWAQGAIELNHLFLGDDQLLSYLIHLHRIEVQELPEIYNWRPLQWLNFNAAVIHWVGGKEHIRAYGGMKPHFDAFFNNSSCQSG